MVGKHGQGNFDYPSKKVRKDEKYQKLQGMYPVIFLSFANIKADNYKETCREISRLIMREYRKHAFLAEAQCLLQAEKNEFVHIMTQGLEPEILESGDLEYSINLLSEYLSRYYGKKVIILLDEYDTPMQEAYVNGYWDELSGFIRRLFNAAFKTNPYLERGLMTGITRVSKESIFSDLNNLKVVTTTSRKYETCFGFTEDELLGALEEFGLSKEAQKAREWYEMNKN